MLRTLLILLTLHLLADLACAQAPLRFVWKQGDAHIFTVQQTIKVTEHVPTTPGGKPTPQVNLVKMKLTRKWVVTAVDASGTATLEMSILALRQEITPPGPNAETLIKDSADPKDAAEMADYLNKPLLKITLDSRGQLVLTDEARANPIVSRLQVELPFRLALPDAADTASNAWERTFPFTVDPPVGTGERYDFKQTYRVKVSKGTRIMLTMSTDVLNPPKAATDMQPLLPLLWSGEIEFDTEKGQYLGSQLRIQKDLLNHAGPGTKFEIECAYSEQKSNS